MYAIIFGVSTRDDVNVTVGLVAAVFGCAIQVAVRLGVWSRVVRGPGAVVAEWDEVQKPTEQLENSRSISPFRLASNQSGHTESKTAKTPMGGEPWP